MQIIVQLYITLFIVSIVISKFTIQCTQLRLFQLNDFLQ